MFVFIIFKYIHVYFFIFFSKYDEKEVLFIIFLNKLI